ncbi:MAG: FAD-dependent oxidoreductase [Burkholderiales bacterium]|nr:FAD-dependent oxidoreductase [Burkholderiales bacterium]
MSDSVISCDALVVGAGAAGMACAISAAHRGLSVIIAEKAPVFGGTTARSGGWLWIPDSPTAREHGFTEVPGAARAYLAHEAGASFDPGRVDAFLAHAAEAVAFFVEHAALRFDMPVAFPDYHAEAPGGSAGGRSIVARPFDGRELGERIRDLAPVLPEMTVLGIMLASGKDVQHFMRVTRSLESFRYVARRLARHWRDVLAHGRGMTLTNGNALAARLAKTVFDRAIPLWLSAPVQDLSIEDGRVTGATVVRDGRAVTVRARRGVVLACGGFPWDETRRRALFPHVAAGFDHVSPSPRANTGDGLALGESAGGSVVTTLANAAAWTPVSRVPRGDGGVGVMPHFIDRAKPGVIAVLDDGCRFANESHSYHDFVQEMVAALRARGARSAHLICDHRALRTYGLGAVGPFPVPIGRHLRSGYLKRGRTIEELAAAAGIDAAALAATLAEYNRDARAGTDPRFGRGATVYNRFQGDALVRPNPNVAPLERPPFYAIRIEAGDIGTFAGLAVDADARVLGQGGRPIAGLYAVGNDAASIMGGNYPGGGITLGPALTFGYLAGRHLAAHAAPAAEPADAPEHRTTNLPKDDPAP